MKIKHFSNRELISKPNTFVERWQWRRMHQAARRQFQQTRIIQPENLESLFSGISKTNVMVHSQFYSLSVLGNVSPHELLVLSSVCAYLKPKRIFEFGTFNGLTTLHLAMNSPMEAKIETIDLSCEDPLREKPTDDTFYTKDIKPGACFLGTEEERKIHQLYGNTLEYDHRALVEKVDFVLVDAGHVYDYVSSDSQKALEIVRPGGVVFWHDYSYWHSGVYVYLNGLAESLPLFQIPETALVCYRATVPLSISGKEMES